MTKTDGKAVSLAIKALQRRPSVVSKKVNGIYVELFIDGEDVLAQQPHLEPLDEEKVCDLILETESVSDTRDWNIEKLPPAKFRKEMRRNLKRIREVAKNICFIFGAPKISEGEIEYIISQRVEYKYNPNKNDESFMIGSPKALAKAIIQAITKGE